LSRPHLAIAPCFDAQQPDVTPGAVAAPDNTLALAKDEEMERDE
jgi:hypothetical protein